MPRKDVPWPIMVISLEGAIERRAAMSAQFHAAGLEFRFIDAVDGRTALPSVWEASIDRLGAQENYGYAMSDGEFACALSHQLVYATVLNEGLPGAVVLEDDAILTPEFAEFYRQGKYREADFIQLFCFSARIWKGPARRILNGVRLVRLAENAFSNVGYCVSPRAAAHLRAAARPLRSRADWPGDLTKVGAMLTVPSIIRHPPPEVAASQLHEGRAAVFPTGFDYSARYVKGWRRLITPASWRRFLIRRLSREINPGF